MTAKDVIADALSTEKLGELTNMDEAWLKQSRQWAQDDATMVLTALTAAGYRIVKLPSPGQPSSHHAATETVWYFCARGEFTLDSYNGSLHDMYGNVWGADELRDMAAAALAAADAAGGED